jgi:H+/Cl- antiporter ClcA
MSGTATPPAEADPAQGLTLEQASATMTSKPFAVLLVLVSIVGVVVSLAAWCFVELVYQIQQEVFTHLPHAVGYSHGPPVWWPLPVLAIAGVIVALAISKLPGNGGHIPAYGLAASGPPAAAELPGLILAGMASIGLGVVIGPEAPLIALGGGLGAIAIRRARSDATDQVVTLVAAAGSFAALSFVFSSPLAAAVIMIEVTAIGGARLRLVLVPGLLAAGIGSLVSLGMGSFTGLSSSAYAISPVPLASFGHPHLGNFAWTIALGIAIAAGTQVIMRGGVGILAIAKPRPLIVLPLAGLLIAGLAIAFSQATSHSVDEVLFDGQAQLPGLAAQAGSYSLGALALLIVCKGAAYSLSLGSFRGGPTFPAMYLGAVAGIMASHLPGFPLTAGFAVGIAAGVSSVLRLPLTAVVIATVLTAKSGDGVEPLIIVGSVVAIVVTLLLSPRQSPAPAAGGGR